MGAKKVSNEQLAEHIKSISPQKDHYEEEHDLMPHSTKKAEEGEGPWLVSYADLMTLLMGFFALVASFSKPDAKEFDKVAASASKYFGGEYKAPYEKLNTSLMKFVKENHLEDKVQIEMTPDGVTMTFSGTLFFDSGEFVVRPDGANLLNKMIPEIRKETTKFNIMIEGHTDDAPIRHPIIASNWELSGIRAARIAQFFEGNNFAREQLTILGWGETKPLGPNTNNDGTPNLENRAKNRRVVIRIFKELPK